MYTKFICLNILFICALSACGKSSSPARDVAPSPLSAVASGDLVTAHDNSDMHHSSVLLEMIDKSGFPFGFCSAVLIDEHAILTSAHCLDTAYIKQFDRFNVLFEDSRFLNPAKRRTGLGFVLHPKYMTESVVMTYRFSDGEILPMTINRRYDLAVGFFSGSIPKGYAPAKIDTNLQRRYEALDVEIYGYGFATHFSPKRKNPPAIPIEAHPVGLLRRGHLQIASSEFELSDLYMTSDKTGAQPCTYDSGSPQFIVQNGHALVVGITSAQLRHKNHIDDWCGDANVATKVAPSAAWITEQVISFNATYGL